MIRKRLEYVFKNITINKPASWMPVFIYVYYLILLSGFKLGSYKKFQSKFSSNFFIHSVSYKDIRFFFPSPIRINRILKGFNHAGARLEKRYFIDQLIGSIKPKTFVDIGANIGELSYYMNKKFGEQIKIFAFEPDPIAYECFENNLNGKNVYLYKLVLSDRSGDQVFYLEPQSADSSIHKPTFFSAQLKVETSTLDLVLQRANLEKPVLLKMDAEGHEPEVLLGAKNVLNQVDFVSIDCGPERSGKTTFNEVSSILTIYGFKNVNISGSGIVTASKY
jgi:FkbM family methyltransferase